MKPESQFVVMTSRAKMPNSMKFGQSSYYNIAVVEYIDRKPKQIHPNHKAVISIPFFSSANFKGETEKCQFGKELEKAEKKAEILNSKADRLWIETVHGIS